MYQWGSQWCRMHLSDLVAFIKPALGINDMILMTEVVIV